MDFDLDLQDTQVSLKIKRKRKRKMVDPCLGFYLPSSPSSGLAYSSSSPPRLVQANPFLGTRRNALETNARIEEENALHDRTELSSLEDALTVEAFLRRGVQPTRRKQRHVKLDNNLSSPFDPNEAHTLDQSKSQFSSSPLKRKITSRPSRGGVRKSRSSRAKKPRLFTDRLLRAAISSGVDVDIDFQTEAKRLLPIPLKFLRENEIPSSTTKPQRWKLVDPKSQTPTRREFSFCRENSPEVRPTKYRSVTLWKPLVESTYKVETAPRRSQSNRVFRMTNQARYPPLQFHSTLDEPPQEKM